MEGLGIVLPQFLAAKLVIAEFWVDSTIVLFKLSLECKNAISKNKDISIT